LSFSSLYAFLFSPTRAVCPTHLILLDCTTLIAFGETHKSWCSHCTRFSRIPLLPPLAEVFQNVTASDIPI
jgi:hypothetical protein